MKKYLDGKYVEMTPEETAAMQKQAAIAEVLEKSRPFTAEEVAAIRGKSAAEVKN